MDVCSETYGGVGANATTSEPQQGCGTKLLESQEGKGRGKWPRSEYMGKTKWGTE